METWLTHHRARVAGKSPLSEALSYIAKYWNGLRLFMTDGRIEIDNNGIERTIRPIALNRKNALFAGHDAGPKTGRPSPRSYHVRPIKTNFGDVSLEQQGEIKGRLKPVEAADAAIAMRYASKVIIVPGYGQAAGVEVKFAVHPVAGRMPGHMDVLLAEAGVPYDLISEMDEINGEFSSTDVVLVIGANDVVNPAARTNKSSPIYGMPILNVDQAHQIYVVKRGQGKGYAGVENELFYAENCNMVYGDAQAVMAKMVQAVKDLVPAAPPVPAAA
jgi:hypothetical protein